MPDRIRELIGDDSPYDVARKFALRGTDLSAQAVYKWLGGGDIGEANLRLLCEIYGTSPAYVRYGIKTEERLTNGQKAAAELIGSAPPQMVQMTLDFLEYQMQKTSAPAVQEHLADYMAMIDRIKRDMDARREATGQ